MIGFDEALAILAHSVAALDSEIVSLDQAANRFLAQDLHARYDAPRCDASVMDGYAVQANSASQDKPLKLKGESRPGAPFAGRANEGEVVRIFTGAPVPEGADIVIMQEYAEASGNTVLFSEGWGPARHIRRAGSDFREGERLLAAGARLTPQAMVAAAAADRGQLDVARRPRLTLIATGDEIVPPGEAHRQPLAQPDTASHAVAALASRMGAELVLHERGRDDRDALSALAHKALEAADCVVVTGGASVGDHDHARPMFAETGMELLFSRIAIKPGKPVWLGKVDTKPVLGLPGNPGSALVTARLFLQPLLAAMQGGDPMGEVATMPLPLGANLEASGSRVTFFRATATPQGLVPVSNQVSGAQAVLAEADWLIRRPPHAPAAIAGSLAEALPL
ncbi:molybdopterin molybdotransferase MoeA [Erythrobacter sp. SD-21]|uniref:molybdopterin molybdotransferase MoeA n=1 Tax=Erythrobacter sp. SD-21 TaxID=161528 RepID=UPI000153F2C2|nr:molybdopterin molybdotransferase MoeA [Erythrobacter sp. SD-21]EDL48341.1 molybdopterin biosynthesis protein MoeA [Erythrobacter sp. SD-21]